MERIIIIGGLSAGPSAAAKARRENELAEILLFEKTNAISYATCGIPYALSGVIPDRKNLLVVEAEMLRSRFSIDVHLEEAITEILPDLHEIVTDKGRYKYTKLIYTAGASTFIPPIKNLELANNWSACRSLQDYDKIMSEAMPENSKHIVILGAGLIGVEVAENLIEAGKQVTIIEGSDQVLPMWESKFGIFAENTLRQNKVQVITQRFVKSVKVNENSITHIQLGENEWLPVDYVIMSVGIRPNTLLLTSKGAEHIGNGALKVNSRMETSLPDIYAAGDCASITNIQTGAHDYLPLGTHSNKAGRAAGANAAGNNESYGGGYKTAIIKIFDKTLARTGLNPKSMKPLGVNYATSLIVAGGTPGYYPNAEDMFIETYYNTENGTVLGCEIYGGKGVDKRIDVMATAIFAKLKITDLPQLDLAYAPPFSPAKDPVAVAGFVASQALNKEYDEISVEDLAVVIKNNEAEKIQLIDVRNDSEIKRAGKIANAMEINLHNLRDSIYKLNAKLPTYVYCAKGLRGYLAYKILKQNGFTNLQNLSGGYTVWNMIKEQTY